MATATATKQTRATRKPKTAAELADIFKAKELELANAKQEQAYLVVADKIKTSTLLQSSKSYSLSLLVLCLTLACWQQLARSLASSDSVLPNQNQPNVHTKALVLKQ
jgi:hypothetical protein